ncbi:MAG TPA: Na+/H+ antiporter NhaA [Polyangiaceae bacterium]|nr:Na+/H+ antiporter NhaA [Polyangiaceae bacterium]
MSSPHRHGETPATAPPGAWAPARLLAQRAIAPVERFLAIQTASGLVLLGAAVLALIWANSPWADVYAALWHTPVGFELGAWQFRRDLHFWINDGLMTVFFFVVGLEIRREIFRGELSELRRATLPLAAAIGGMALPALLYLAFNHGRVSAAGWGVPMATDIAFAVGVLALLGKRVAPALRILLLALAVIDDVGAILVIAFFYSTGFVASGFGVLALGVAAILLLQMVGVRSWWAYLLPAVVVWAGAYSGGVHPTLAGVLVGLMTPAKAWLGGARFLDVAERNVQSLRAKTEPDDHELLVHLQKLKSAGEESVSPVERLQHALHGWVAFLIMPLFALANAGVPVGNASLEGDGLRVFLGIIVGLLVGKTFGVVGFAWLARRLGIASLPRGVRSTHVVVVGLAAAIGFTMALFIAQLAFPSGALLETAKLAILIGSVLGGVAAYLAGRQLLPTVPDPTAAMTEADAEASTHA